MAEAALASLGVFLPEAILAGGAVLLLVADAIRRVRERAAVAFGIAVTLAALCVTALSPEFGPAFSGQLDLDGLALAARLIVMSVLVLVLLLSSPRPRPAPESVSLLMFAAAGLSGVAASRHWLVLFVFLELSAISIATLLGGRRELGPAREASLKYFILSAFASAFLLYGIALLFYATGSFAVGWPEAWGPAERLAVFLILAGLAFKCSLVPFHMWAPDVYQGGPIPVAAFLAGASKAVGFLVLARVFLDGALVAPGARQALAAVSALSMVVGTVLALAQQDLKRMLAYSGIAHAGFIALALVAGTAAAQEALLVYLLVYALSSVAAFAVLSSAEEAGVEPTFAGFSGLGRRSPLLAVALATSMVSLTGLPPTAGFVAKFLVFREALAAGRLALVILAVVSSVVSVGFYLRLLVPVFMEGGQQDRPLRPSPEALVVAVALAAAVLLLGVLPEGLISFASGLACR